MYRLQVQDQAGNEVGYNNVDNLSESEFIVIATGARPATTAQGDWPPPGTVYSAVWDAEHNTWLRDISAEEAVQHYPHCSQEQFP